MARLQLLVAPLAALAVAASAAGAARVDRTVHSPGAVTAVASGRQTVAFASEPAAGDCDRVRIWSLATRAVTRLGAKRPCGDVPSTGRGIAALAIAGSRALWLEYAGGNIREWMVYTATRTAPRPRLLRFVARDVDGPRPVVLGDGDATLLAYSVEETVVGLRANGSRAFSWRAPGRVTALATGDGKVAALLASGPIVLLSSSGSRLAEYDYAPGVVKALRVGGVGTLVQLEAGSVEVRKGAARRVVALPATATMLDFGEGVVLYALAGQARGRRTGDGADALLRTTGTPVRAALDASGLTYVRGRRVGFVPWRQVAATLSQA